MSYKGKRVGFVIVVTLLVLVEIASVFLMYKSSTDIVTKLDDVKLREKNNSLAIMVEQSDGTYTQSDSNTWPTDMKFNSEKSGCIDNTGNKIENALSYDSSTNIATVETGTSTYCYLYFDKIYTLSELCSNGDNLVSCLTDNNSEIDSLNDSVEGGLYRYQGTQDTVNDNYICFGTTDKSECASNTDAYMYRIMGVNENGQLKLIKKEALESAHAGHSIYTTDIAWPNSDLYGKLNGSAFLSNTTYVPSGWSDKIAITTWKYGDNTTNNTTAANLYSIENAWINSTNTKIGLMYMHDYYYAYQSGGLNCSQYGDYNTCKTAWMHLSVSDSGAPSVHEWTMSRYGSNNGDYGAWFVASNGLVGWHRLDDTASVRPVFYLNTDEIYVSGNGILDDPIIIGEPELTAAETIMAMETTGLNTTMEAGLYRYQGTTADNYICFGTSDKDTCTGNTDAYMYRIIGINESGQMKVMKNEALNSAIRWYSDASQNIKWPSSTIYSNINGSSFLSNTTYVPSGWSDKIVTTTWKYGDNTNVNVTASALYDIENAWTNTTSAKIGLIYAHDYFYAYQSGGLDCSSSGGNVSICKTAWMFLGICDSGAPNVTEWTMSRYGYSGDYYRPWCVNSAGYVNLSYLDNTASVRPVFYLTSDVEFVGGTGTSSDPFLIS